MLNLSLKELFEKAKLPVNLDNEKEKKFLIYLRELKKWNEKINLTSLKDETEIIEKLFIDSLFFLKFLRIKATSQHLDIGSGAGFPAIPIKIIFPHINLTLLEVRKKKASFLKHVIRFLSLKNTKVIDRRFEEIHKCGYIVENFDLITIRGIGITKKIITISYNLLNQGGIFIYFGGKRDFENSYLNKTPFAGFDLKTYQLPFSKLNRTLLVFKK